jgi:hypothetical protein
MTAVSSIYTNGKHYDRLFPTSAEYLNYWSTLAQTYGDPILEIMCGTGLISTPESQQRSQRPVHLVQCRICLCTSTL